VANASLPETIPLQKGILYGPVLSRRLGRSLGLNILPDEIKVCSLDCGYCQYSWTGLLSMQPAHFASFLPTREEVHGALEAELVHLKRKGTPPDTITFSGNGEATLHPDFPAIAADVRDLRDAHAPKCRTAILSNATTVGHPAIRRALLLLDDPILKLDTARAGTFQALNGPAKGLGLDAIVGGLRAMEGKFVLQALFVRGSVDNSTDEEVADWVRLVSELHPRSVQVYTLDRGPADGRLRPVPAARLRAIASALRGAGLDAYAFV
jgi:wyosine [tRNA(Phe)-imidazoG37] synthetase (radical SAM superfamily)